MTTPRTQDVLACALLTGLWWLPVLVIGIAGEFPISDDWSYAHTVQVLLETGRFERPAWTWAPSLTNVGLGAAFSWLGGFSFAALRLSTLFAGWLGVLACYGLARGIGAGVTAAALAAVCLAVNPIYVHLSFTFMTDIAFVALTTGSLMALAA
ncbi:MAG: phospholipid carrier-dependent glycosyltransferase, partial [Deltaproteobacteria bacterium]|nr:phospholipid carrier-dependent glycosyltransferase [Deltaproteobacteria bacterium]